MTGSKNQTLALKTNYFRADVQENIFERLLSLMKRSPPPMPSPERAPDSNVQTEPASDNRMGGPIEQQRMHQKLVLGTLQQAVFSRICQLSQTYGFQLIIVWPPLPQSVTQVWEKEGEFGPLNAQIKSVFANGCNAGTPLDINAVRTYTNFNRDGFHLHGEGWEERYAADLSGYIAALPDRRVAAASN